MTNEEMIREIGSLPPEAQRLVESFVTFLRQRYARPVAAITSVAMENENFIGMWKDRDDMTDSGAWVRSVRMSEWER